MPRAYSKCGSCLDLIWFADADLPPQAVECICGETILTEEGATGNPIEPTAEEIESMT